VTINTKMLAEELGVSESEVEKTKSEVDACFKAAEAAMSKIMAATKPATHPEVLGTAAALVFMSAGMMTLLPEGSKRKVMALTAVLSAVHGSAIHQAKRDAEK
jgi:hypothetical protein